MEPYENVWLQNRLGRRQRAGFISRLWNQHVDPGSIGRYGTYFDWLRTQLDTFLIRQNGEQLRVTVATYGGLIRLVDFVRNHVDVPRHAIPAAMDHGLHDDYHIQVDQDNINYETAYPAIELAVRVWGMVNFSGGDPGESEYPWNYDESLTEALTKFLPSVENPQTYEVQREGIVRYRVIKDNDPPEPDCDVEFSGFFTLFDMERLTGFNIQWTNNILSHLRFRKLREPGFATTVFVFHHATILPHVGHGGPVVQRAFAREALQTLGLLMPPDEDCQTWFTNRRGRTIDQAAGDQSTLNMRVRDYRSWRSRLLALEKEFEKSSPRSIPGWWRDRRNRQHWFPFWVSAIGLGLIVLSSMFSFSSMVTGAISAARASANAHRGESNSGATSEAICSNSTAFGSTAAADYCYLCSPTLLSCASTITDVTTTVVTTTQVSLTATNLPSTSVATITDIFSAPVGSTGTKSSLGVMDATTWP